MLPCADIDEIGQFWTALGLRVTYRQLRPNPYVVLGLGGIDLHYYGMPGHDPEQSHSTCGIVVSDTEPLHALFAKGFRESYGTVPQSGAPRMTRPRRRANNAGLSGFSVIDPAGNWVRVSRRPASEEEKARAVDDRLEWASSGGGPLARALENAVVQGDSHGDPEQAHRILAGALARHPDATVADRAAAWAYAAELRLRLDDPAGAREAAGEVEALDDPGLTGEDRAAVDRARRELAELPELDA
nr:hypothetical protein [Ornithinimicrobium sp. F0845]